MEWEFNKEFQDQIIYSMENQDETFVLDIRKGIIVPETQIDSEEIGRRFHRLPEWRSLEGYQLMERFIASIRNPIFREELRSALSSGTGVFRQFKNSLKKRKELEKLWFSFKEKEMTRVVFDWFNQIRELEGLERLNPPIEETDELISSDFHISENIENHIQDILDLDRQVIMDAYQDIEESRLLDYYETLRESLPALNEDGSLVAVAETPSGEFAGFVWGVHREDPPFEGTVVDLIQLAIMKEYQGLGLGQALLSRFIKMAHETSAEKVQIHLAGRFLNAVRLFELRGFHVSDQTMELDLASWEMEEGPFD